MIELNAANFITIAAICVITLSVVGMAHRWGKEKRAQG